MNNQICKIHNDPALFIEQDKQHNQVFLCRFCVQQRLKIRNIDDVVKEEKQALKQLEMQFDQCIKFLNDFTKVLDNFIQQIQQKLKKFKYYVEKSTSNMIENKNQVKAASNNFTNLQIKQINEQKSIITNSLAQIVQQLNTQIKELEISTRLNQLHQSIDEKFKLLQQGVDIKKITEIEKQFVQKDDLKQLKGFEKKFDYQLMQKSSYKQDECCLAIAYNKDATIMIAGCLQLIKIFEFKEDKLRELQLLNGHSNRVTCLRFMKKQNQFISGSSDSTIKIWQQNQNQLWSCNQILKSHQTSILCIQLDQNEELIMSGSSDKTIKFWKKQQDIWSCNQSINCSSAVYSISLNNQEDELIASVENKQILVLQLQANGWKIKQNISVEQDGYRLCYINQNQFVFQPQQSQHLQIFYNFAREYHKGEVLQYKNQETQEDSLFPIQYLSQIGLIIVKNGSHLYLIKKNQNDQFTVEQSINFNTFVVYGCITDDGRYMTTWDEKSQEIQIRKFQY